MQYDSPVYTFQGVDSSIVNVTNVILMLASREHPLMAIVIQHAAFEMSGNSNVFQDKLDIDIP